MNNIQRQQLLYFATGSAALPATIDTTTRGPNESLTQSKLLEKHLCIGEGVVLDVLLKRQLYWTWCNTERILDIHSIEDSVIFGEYLGLKLCRISVLCRRFKSTVVLVLLL